jgi:prepilin-type N-terminal cleavage/methylation domain-containing protein
MILNYHSVIFARPPLRTVKGAQPEMIASVAKRGFTLLEIMIAVTLLAACFVPILMHSQQTVKETGESQENLLARHFLLDMVERWRDANLDELRLLPKTEPNVVLGSDPPDVKNDAVLSDRERVLKGLKDLATATGQVDGGQKGFQQFEDLVKLMKMTRVVWFEEKPFMKLNFVVRWKISSQAPERRISFVKVMDGAVSRVLLGTPNCP